MFGSSFGVGTPSTYPVQSIPSYGTQGLNINPFALQQLYGQPSGSVPSSWAAGMSQYGAQPLQQVLQLLQVVPQQLQNLQQLAHQQQQQLQQVQQLIQGIPAQLWQLQQLIQFVPQQIQQAQQASTFQQPFGQPLGLGGFPATPIVPQFFGAQPTHVM
jgi:hypothetical protein